LNQRAADATLLDRGVYDSFGVFAEFLCRETEFFGDRPRSPCVFLGNTTILRRPSLGHWLTAF
jgi:hypothetical protein